MYTTFDFYFGNKEKWIKEMGGMIKDVFYLLKAKCNLMERIFNVKIGDLIFKKKTQGF